MCTNGTAQASAIEPCPDICLVGVGGADLTAADLTAANLTAANLRGTDLRGTRGTSDARLMQARSVKSTIMPYGEKHS